MTGPEVDTVGPDAPAVTAVVAGYGDRLRVGAEIGRLRAVADLSVAALASLAGLSPAVLRRYESGGGGALDLGDLRAIAAGLGTTAGVLIDAASPPTTGGHGRLVLLPTLRTSTSTSTGAGSGTGAGAAVWRLVQYVPRPVGQTWHRPDLTEPERTVSRSVLDWASALTTREPVQVFGSAIELTGARSWYIGADRGLIPGRRP